MNRSVVNAILAEYDKKREKALTIQKQKVKKAYKEIPELEEIDNKIKQIGLSTTKEILAGNGDEESAKKAAEKINALKMEKAYILTEKNLEADHLEIKYECDICKDQGYLENGQRCSCLKKRLVEEAYKNSNMTRRLEKENFSKFDINVFDDSKREDEPVSSKENMMEILSIAEDFIERFDKDNGENLLFYGSTGLGKTFMCSCIAKELLERDKSVVYQTAFNIIDILERKRFDKEGSELSEYQYRLMLESDLFIVDDLGTELSNSFTNAEIFNIVNTRLLNGKKTIISTNLTPMEISSIYTDRIFSRIFQQFVPLKFYGKDLRWE